MGKRSRTYQVKLDNRQLAVIVLSARDGMDNQAIAKALGITLKQQHEAFVSALVAAVRAKREWERNR